MASFKESNMTEAIGILQAHFASVVAATNRKIHVPCPAVVSSNALYTNIIKAMVPISTLTIGVASNSAFTRLVAIRSRRPQDAIVLGYSCACWISAAYADSIILSGILAYGSFSGTVFA